MATADWGGVWLNRLAALNRYFCRRLHRLSADTRLPLPASGPALVVANHLSGLDPLLLIAASDRPLRFLIAEEQYQRPLLHWLFRAVGAIPVARTGRPERAFREALRALAAGEVVALFPEGGIALPDAPPRPLKRGFCRLAQIAAAPVCAVHIRGVGAPGAVVAAVWRPSRVVLQPQPLLRCHELSEAACLAQVSAALAGGR